MTSKSISVTIDPAGVQEAIESISETVGVNQRVRQLKISALGKMGLGGSDEGAYSLFYQDSRMGDD